ncbi:hypothetical protein RRG08_062290 [Elysia crispata]|uniref:Uncharacterized protein n=1 Tax=Elysia crispata TaxID=231223 RepID=A0AAE0YGW3_9GAST|nr:hypothetical protein RRG08_062290 [Elysia crispata]
MLTFPSEGAVYSLFVLPCKPRSAQFSSLIFQRLATNGGRRSRSVSCKSSTDSAASPTTSLAISPPSELRSYGICKELFYLKITILYDLSWVRSVITVYLTPV